jgi:hypothetical protein
MEYERIDEWMCLSCEGQPEFADRAAALNHIYQVHGRISPVTGTKSLKMHLNFGAGHGQFVYEWDFGDFKMQQSVGSRSVAKPGRRHPV